MKRKYRIAALTALLAVVLTGCSPDGIPSFRAMMLGEPEMIAFSYDPFEYVTLGQYKNVEVDTAVTDEEIQSVIDDAVISSKAKSDAKVVKKDDLVNINYSGEIDGKEFDGGSSEDVPLRIGSGSMIDGFEDAIIGVKVGEEKKANLTFPKDYNKASYAGKDVVFAIKVNYIYKEADDAIIKSYTESQSWTMSGLEPCDTLEKFKEYVKAQIKAQKEQNTDSQALSKVMEDSQFAKIPDELVKDMKDMVGKSVEQEAQRYGYTDAEAYLEARYNETEQSYYESFAKERLLVEAVVKEEGYRVTKEVYQEKLNEILKNNGIDEKTYREQFKQYYTDKISFEEYMVYAIKHEFYTDLVINSVKKK